MKKIVIVGAGPAGCSAAFFLGQMKIPHVLLEKHIHPRPKVCGDGLAPKACFMLERMRAGSTQWLLQTQKTQAVWGGRVFSSGGHRAEIYLRQPHASALPNAMSIPRREFDYWLTQQLDLRFTDFRQGCSVQKIERRGNQFILLLNHAHREDTLTADILLGCDGDRSIVRKTLAPARLDPKHYFAAIRTYFRGVQGLHEHHFFELFFLKELLPGYFWIFPLPDGTANVGLGMLTADVSARRANLRAIFQENIARHPVLRDRFDGATQMAAPQGWGLPLGSKMGKLSGDGFLLAGDAASMIDPLTGEGVGNALYSGWLAAEAITKAVELNRTDASILHSLYDRRVQRTLRPALRFSQFWSRVFEYPHMTDHILKKLGTDPVVQRFINTLYDTAAFRRQRYNPFFYGRFLLSLF